MDANVDIGKLAEKLVRVGRQGVAWERKKLAWIFEQKKQADEKSKSV